MTAAHTPRSLFELETRNHQMTMLKDDGLYRHLRFKQPDTMFWHFDLVTWPGHLVITGDVEDFHFARTTDMFEFFRHPVGYINPGYWAQKLRGPVRYQSYSPEQAKRRVYEAFMEARQWRPGPHRPLWRRICEDVLAYDVLLGESTFRRAIDEFHYEGFEFTDSWEWDLTEYDHHFLVSLHAIVWGIAQYDHAKEPVHA